MNLRGRLASVCVVSTLMCLGIYQIRKWDREEYKPQYLDQKIHDMEEKVPSLQEDADTGSVEHSDKLYKDLKSNPDIIPQIPETASGVVDDAETGVNKRLQIPRLGQEMNPVIKKHLEDLKSINVLNFEPQHAPAVAFSKLEPRDTTLTPVEEKLKQVCVQNGPRDRAENGTKFFGPGQTIRWLHHSYLGNDKFMVEVGGNWGWDAGNFSKTYNPRYFILEPLSDFVRILRKKFENNPQVSVYNLGLGAKNESFMVTLEGNNACATSKFSGKKGTVPIYIINAVDFFAGFGVGAFDIDLLTMNCEGCEYEVLETLLASNIIKSIRNIQWATHSTLKMNDPIGRYCRIEQLLLRTHRPTYQFRLAWESWRRRDIA